MGNEAYSGIKQKALKIRNDKLENQMVQVVQIINKYNINHPLTLCSLTVQQAVHKLNKNIINSQMLVACLAYMTATVGKQLNLFTLTNFSQALELARQCDRKRKESGMRNWTFYDIGQNQQNYLPPLFGIPISVKDVYDMKDFPTTIGLKSRMDDLKQESPIITCFLASGLIPFVRSNVPQYCMSAQTNNLLWGRSISPWNVKRSVGGSSGGQGGLISARCSILGVGSDIGGSIRVPAQHCGIFGLKPSSKRISNIYHAQLSKIVTAMSHTIPLCIGPLGKSARDLAMFMKIVTNQQYYCNRHDPYVKIDPFNTQRFMGVCRNEKKLRIGYIKQLQCVKPSPTSKRALQQVLQILRNQGHELIQIKIPNQNQLIRQYLLQLNATKSKYLREILQGQTPTPQNNTVIKILQMNPILSLITKYYSKYYLKSVYMYSFSKQLSSIFEYQRHIGEIYRMKNRWVQYWKGLGLDFGVCVGFPCQAIPHGESNNLGYVLAYTFIWNILDMVVGSLPVTVVQENQQYYESQVKDAFTKKLELCAKQSVGLPAGVQVIGLPYREEEVLGLMDILEKQIRFYKKYPLPNPVHGNKFNEHNHQID